jgi:hypothetical protein
MHRGVHSLGHRSGGGTCTHKTSSKGWSGKIMLMSKKSRAEDAMGVVDMSEKGKKDSSKTTCREIRMRFD